MRDAATFRPDPELRKIIDAVKESVDDFSPAMEQISRVMLDDTREVFASGLSEWPRMSEATVERWGPHPLLRLGGRAGRRGPSTPLEQWNERRWSKTNAAVINRAPHAHLMEGGVEKGGRMVVPQRDFLFVNEASYPLFRDFILDHVEDAFLGA
jgi:hypothetical protein